MVATNRITKHMAPRDGELVEITVSFDEPEFRPNWWGLSLVAAFVAGLFARGILWR